MSVCFTNKNIHVQFIDDAAGVTLAATSTISKGTADREKLAANAASAKTVGALAARGAAHPHGEPRPHPRAGGPGRFG